MAGLVAAARARELGADVVVYEKGDRKGGSMLLSSGVIWRHRDFADFRAECPGGDEPLQRQIFERLDDGIDWLEQLGAKPVWQNTENPLTTGRRYEPKQLTEVLVRAAGEVRLGEPVRAVQDAPLVLATGGFAARLARERGLFLRASPWSEGDGLELGRSRGAGTAGDLEEFYGRALPAPPARVEETDFVRLSQLYGARVLAALNEDGAPFFEGDVSWSENDLAQAIGRQPGGRAWYVLGEDALADPDVEARVEAAREAGGSVLDAGQLPFAAPDGSRLAVLVAAGVTHTIGGLRIDETARVLREDGTQVEGLFAAGVDAGGVATGGYSSGLAQALVFGRIAAETALA